MSEATDRPADDDAWARACAEDLEAEKARRRARYGPQPGTAAEELRKLIDAVADRISSLPSPPFGGAAQDTVRQIVEQAKSAARPVVERNPEVFDHLAAAGGELLAAYRSAVAGQERRWTRDTEDPSGTEPPGDSTDPRDQGPGGEQIDLD